MKILFAATPIPGHLNPLLTIARMAMGRGDEAVVVTGARLRPAVEAAGARFLPLSPDADAFQPDPVRLGAERLPPGHARVMYMGARLFFDPMPAQLATLRAAIAEEGPDIVVAESFFMGRVALFLDPRRPPVPLVSWGISFLPLDRPDGAPPFLGLPPARDGADRERYAALAAEREAASIGFGRDLIDGMLSDQGLPALPCSMNASWVSLADAYLHPTVPSFEYDYGPLPAHMRFVGALPPPPPRGGPLPDWWGDLDRGRPVVLVTQGTMANVDLDELIEPTLAALADRDDLLVVATTGGRSVDDVRGPIPGNARLAEFLDYEALLPKLSALVTNGGYGTVQLALRAGVPIVAAGRSEDKAEVGARIAWSGVGVEIPMQRPSVEALREAIERVLSDPSYRVRAGALAADMAALDTRAEILGTLDRLVAGRSGGAQAPAPR